MVTIVQNKTTVYINSSYVKTVTFKEESNEARVLYTSGEEIRYSQVEKVDVNY